MCHGFTFWWMVGSEPLVVSGGGKRPYELVAVLGACVTSGRLKPGSRMLVC
jgi:hypothetical protein